MLMYDKLATYVVTTTTTKDKSKTVNEITKLTSIFSQFKKTVYAVFNIKTTKKFREKIGEINSSETPARNLRWVGVRK